MRHNPNSRYLHTAPTLFAPLQSVDLASASAKPGVEAKIVYGLSGGSQHWWQDAGAAELGYEPQDNADDFTEKILESKKEVDHADTAQIFQGGPWAAYGWSADSVQRQRSRDAAPALVCCDDNRCRLLDIAFAEPTERNSPTG